MRTTQWIARTVCAVVLAALGTVTLGAQTAGRTGGPSEGITVHGHWTIEIKNPDGTLVERHEFENALGEAGPLFLSAFLGRQWSPGLWNVKLTLPPGGSTQDSFCGPTLNYCLLSEENGNLDVRRDQGVVVLSGSYTLPADRTFVGARTELTACAIGFHGCQVPDMVGNFTIKSFSAIPVVTGQIVTVTVRISFT